MRATLLSQAEMSAITVSAIRKMAIKCPTEIVWPVAQFLCVTHSELTGYCNAAGDNSPPLINLTNSALYLFDDSENEVDAEPLAFKIGSQLYDHIQSAADSVEHEKRITWADLAENLD